MQRKLDVERESSDLKTVEQQRRRKCDAEAVRFHDRIRTFIDNYHLEDVLDYSYSCMDVPSPCKMDRFTRFWLKVNRLVPWRLELLRDLMDLYGMSCRGIGPFGGIFLCAEAGGGYMIYDNSMSISSFRTKDVLKRRIMSRNLVVAIKDTKKNINTAEWLRGGNNASGPLPEDITRYISMLMSRS